MPAFRTLLAASTSLALFLGSAGPLAAGDTDGCKVSLHRLAINPSVIVNDQTILKDSNFGFAKTIGAILASQGGTDNAANRTAFVQTMLESFNATQQTNPASGLKMAVDARPDEAGLDPAKLLNASAPEGLHPVGVFNRLDLAPQDFSNCGEYRIVYTTRAGSPIDRFFLIFEARVANPDGTGFAGCRPIAEFWAGLNGKSKSAKAAALENFYYTGSAGIGPVVQARNYGQPDGQVRANAFVNFTKWQLREFLVGNFGPAGGTFVATTVKTNPLTELYADASPASSLDGPLEETVRTEFFNKLETQNASELVGVDGTFPNVGPTDAGALQMFKQELFAGLATNIDGKFDEFQSDSQGDADDPLVMSPSPGRARTALTNFLSANPLPHNREVVAGQALVRLGALTCGGCHQFTNGGEIGTVNGEPIFWPSSLGFVHIDEDSNISEALSEWFLPARRQNLRDALCEPEAYAGGGETQPAGDASISAVTASSSEGSRAAAVDAAAERVRNAPTVNTLRESTNGAEQPAPVEPPALTEYKDVVEGLREDEREKPGAFVRIRRVH